MRFNLFAALLCVVVALSVPAYAQIGPTTFIYQGHLVDNGEPANGEYNFEVRLLDNQDNQVSVILAPSAMVTDGNFTLELDFGPGVFDGSSRYLEISVRSAMDGGPFTKLSPDQPITSAPFAQFALSGNEGPAGPQGPTGSQGSVGPQGQQGQQGQQGPAGTTLWSGLSGIPAGFADNTDNDTTYAAGSGLALDGNTLSIPLNGINTSMLAAGSVFASDLANDFASFGKVSGGVAGINSGALLIGAGLPLADERVQIYAGTDSSASGGGYLTVGNFSGTQISIDDNEIMARDSGVAARLSFNVDGGDIVLGNSVDDGLVGIGTSAPSDRLHVNADDGQSAFRIRQGSNTRFRVNANGGISLGINNTVVADGNTYVHNSLGIGDPTPDAPLDVVGDGVISGVLTVGTTTPQATFDLAVSGTAAKTGGGSWAVFSDRRLKKNIQSMIGSLDTIAALRPVNFEYKSEDHFSYLPGVQRGFIAQEVQKVIPQWVHTADDGYYYLDQTGYEALIVDAIQELRAEKDSQIKQLQTENKILQARLGRIERALAILSNKN